MAGARVWSRVRWLAVPLCLAAGATVATQYTAAQDPVYRAEAMVLLTVRGGSVGELVTGGTVSQDQVTFYADVVTTEVVLDPVISELGLDVDASTLAGRMDVQSESNTVVLRIGVRDRSGPRAAQIAGSVAERFQAVVETLAPKRTDGRPPVAARLVSTGELSSARVSPQPRANLAVGLLVGLAIGLALLIPLRRVSRPVSSRDLVARVTDVPVIGSIIHNPGAEHRPLNARSRLARPEAYRMLRTTLRLRRPDESDLCLVVTSSVHGEGRSSTTVDLGLSMAHTARRVLLVDADLDRPGLTALLRMDGSVGLAQVLAGEAEPEDAIRTWRTPTLLDHSMDVLPAGLPVPGAGQLLSSTAMDELLVRLRNRYDRILIDTGPLLAAADGAVLAARTDGALLLVDSRRTRQRELAEAVTRLEMAGATLVGVVLTRVPPPTTGAGVTRAAADPAPAPATATP